MKKELKYIELKSDYNHDGPAWIAYVEFSKSGKTMYFNGKALKSNGHGISIDIETREIYWISGIRKVGSNRHIFGMGGISIEEDAVQEYLNVKGWTSLDPLRFTIVNLIKTDKLKYKEIENRKLDHSDKLIIENIL